MDTSQKAPIGRPRGFDADEALERAVRVFWEKGYEGASLADLTSAMGINRPSMYAAFGNKDELFRKALERYTEGPAAYVNRALAEPTAREVVTAFLHGAVRTATRPGDPHGCLGIQGGIATGDQGRRARDLLAAWRESGCSMLRERFQRAVDEGDLPEGTDAGLLARYVMTVTNGLAVQAAGGTSREELEQVVEAILHTWPPQV
ncbi:TetR/AcrR family transcriptional regulator [Melissospora conviva]|uniref:TetR/AcrR family transcriptional regulator n=1 Tax=Melissospora conviva TaxID=3388432 RepID=UPI003B7B898B